MRPVTLVRLALAGSRTDGLRVVLTAFSATLATLAILAALTVLAVPELGAYVNNERYANALLDEPGLRGGTAFALILLTIPVLALAGQCARLGAPARDRRLAGFRLAGATPGQATLVAVTETGIAALLGALAGTGVYFAARPLLDRPGADGLRPLPTDVLPSPTAIVVTVVALPLVAALATAVLMRKVVIGPFGVVRRAVRTRAPLPWPGALIVVGLVAVAVVGPVTRWLGQRDIESPVWTVGLTFFVGGLLAAIGVVLGTAWISYTMGRLLHRSRHPSALLAARRLTADPWHGGRTFAALLTCLIVGAGAAGIRGQFTVMRRLETESAGEPMGDSFYLDTMALVDLAVVVAVVIAAGGLLVAVADGIVSRRRAYAALVASGVPKAVISRSILWQSLAPAAPAIAVALVVGAGLVRGLMGDTVENYGRSAPVPLPIDNLIGYGLLGVLAVLLTAGVGLLFLRSSTAVEELRVG